MERTKVAGTWRNVANQWTKVNGVWRKVINKWTKVNGVWRLVYAAVRKYYTNGVENVAWVPGYNGGGTATKNTDYLYLYSDGSSTRNEDEASFVTDLPMNLTNVKTLYVEWQFDTNLTESAASAFAYFLVSTSKMSNRLTYNASKFIGAGEKGVKRIDSLDVSTLSGDFYIRLHTREIFSGYASAKIYRVWGE